MVSEVEKCSGTRIWDQVHHEKLINSSAITTPSFNEISGLLLQYYSTQSHRQTDMIDLGRANKNETFFLNLQDT